jgi:chromatin remodeling complex protein RSC6
MIILDEKLIDLLQPPEGVQVTFLNIQKYLSPHYVKVEKPAKEKKEKEPAPVAAAAEPAAAEAPKKRVVKKVKPAAV